MIADLTARLTRKSRSNFYYAFLTLPRPRREALYAVYAFCRTVDDIADLGGERGVDPPVQRRELRRWREEIGRASCRERVDGHVTGVQTCALPISMIADLTARLTRKSRSNFYYAFLTLPRPRREALYAVYAFCRTVDDIADLGGERGVDPPVQRRELRRWRE